MENELPFSDAQIAVEKCTLKFRGRAKSCARNSYNHLRKAWRLLKSDPEMSALRAITAEEESISCLIHLLKQKHYENASSFNPTRHWQKAVFFPFIEAVIKKMHFIERMGPRLIIRPDLDPPRIDIRLETEKVLNITGVPDDRKWIQIDEPLEFLLKENDATLDIGKSLDEFAKKNGFNNLNEWANAEANIRNRLLYASDDGIPGALVPSSFIIERLRRVTIINGICVTINQSGGRQLLIRQLIDDLAMLIDAKATRQFEMKEIIPNAQIEVEIAPGLHRSSFSQRYVCETTLGLEWLGGWPPVPDSQTCMIDPDDLKIFGKHSNDHGLTYWLDRAPDRAPDPGDELS